MENQWHSVDASVPMRTEKINGVDCDVEPTWDDVVKALKTEITRREMTWNWPVGRSFKQEERSPDGWACPFSQKSKPNEGLKHIFENGKQESQYAARPSPVGWNHPFASIGPPPPLQIQPKKRRQISAAQECGNVHPHLRGKSRNGSKGNANE